MATYSGLSGSVITNFQLYDYNYACGFVAIAPAPTTLQSVTVSLSATEQKSPTSVTENQYFENSYTVYITVLTKNDYEYGATYHFKMNGPFIFTGSVESISKTCTEEDAGCVTIHPLTLNSDYSYKITEDDSVLTFVRYQNSSGLAIAHDEYLKIKAKVKNPNYVSTSGSMTVHLVSNYAKYIYEYKTENSLFSTKVIEMGTNSTLYFWGIPYNAGTNSLCPIRVYLSDNYAIWNKITIRFYAKLSFPDSDGFEMHMDVNNVGYVNDLSIITDMNSMGQGITCETVTASSSDYIKCNNIGTLSQNVVQSVKFSYVVKYASNLDLTNFGKLEFYHQGATGEKAAAITNSITPPDNNLTQLVKNAEYNTKTTVLVPNPVVDVATTHGHDQSDYAEVFGQTGATTGRSSIKAPGSTAIDLLLILQTDFDKSCCGAGDPELNGEGCIANSYDNGSPNDVGCDGGASGSLVIKVLANVNALSFDDANLDDSSVSDIYKGVEIMFESDEGGTAAKSFLGGKSVNTIDDLCISIADDAENICNNNQGSEYLTLSALSTGSLYTYNQWYKRDSYWELHLTCASLDLADSVCGGVTQAAVTTYSGIRIKDVTLNTQANPLYPDQYELDFIVCYRFVNAIASSAINVDSTTTILASSGVYNAQIINIQTAFGKTASDTILRVGILNYYAPHATDVGTGSVIDYKYIPTILRVGGNMHSNDVSSNEGVGFFFDAGLDIGQSQGTLTFDPTQCASPLVASPVCKYFARKTIGITVSNMHGDYYPGLNLIIMGGTSVTGGNEFNYYIPVKITAAFSYAFIALINSYSSNPTIAKIYKVVGSKEINHATYPIPTSLFSFSTYATPNPVVYTTYGSGQVSNGQTISQSQIIDSGFNSEIKPSGTSSNLILDATVSTGFTDELSDNQDYIGASATQFVAAAHFQVHSFEHYWNGASLSWDMEGSSTSVPFKGTCTQMQFTSTLEQYMIICPYEGTFAASPAATTLTGKGTLKLNISSWQWPDYYGEKSGVKIGSHLRFLWTGQTGNLLAFWQSGLEGNAVENCTLGSAASIFAYNTTQQKAQLQVSPLTSLKLKAAAAGEGDRKKMLIVVNVNASQPSDPKITQCNCGITNVKCTVGLNSNDKDFTFTLQNIDPDNEITIPASQITLTFWLFSSTSTVINDLNYSATVEAYFYTDMPAKTASAVVINECKNAETWQGIQYQDRTITVGDPSRHSLVKSSRTNFTFTFVANYDVIDTSKFKINLAFLESPNSGLIDNLRCGLFTSKGISHDFSTFNYASLSQIEIQYKQTQTTLDYPTTVTASFTFKCDGGEVIDNEPSSTSLVTVENYVGAEKIGSGSCVDQSEKYGGLKSVSGESSIASISMTRLFDSVGQDSTYKFTVVVQGDTVTNSTTNQTTTTMRYLAGSHMYIEFARDLAPRFNKLGIIRCYHENLPTYCNYESERRIALLIRTDLNHNNSYGHNFTVVGIQRPATFARNKVMYFALVPYLSSFKSMTFHDGTSISDEAPDTLSSTLLPVVYYSQDTSTAIRSTYSFTMHIKFPAASINSDVPLWIDFPEEFDEAMFLGWNPSCTLKNVKINETDNITNFVAGCATNITRRIKINLTTDEENTSNQRLYSLTISGIPTYMYQQSYANPPLVWMGNSTNVYIPYYKTNLGYFNGTENLEKFTFTESSTKQLLYWHSNIPQCYIGVYGCSAKIIVNTGVKFQADVETITAGGMHSSYFSFNPSNIKMETGVSNKEFEIAPKYGTAPGLYQLTWSHDGTKEYSDIPPLFIIARNSKLQIAPESTSYDVPHKGYSLPIIFRFANMMPESDVSITGRAESDLLNATGTETSRYVSFKSETQSLSFSESYASDQIQFIVNGEKITGEGEPDQPQAELFWTLSGTNQNAYEISVSSTTVTVVDQPEGTPELTLESPDQTKAGSRTFTATCTHNGNLYYVASQSESDVELNYTTIKDATEEKQIQETEVGTVYTNPSRTFYGFRLYTGKGSPDSFDIFNKFQSEAIYHLKMYCVNQIGTVSESKSVTWKQTSNGGKPLVATIQLEREATTDATVNTTSIELTSDQQKEIACIICRETKTEKNRVFGTNGVACSDSGTVESSNSTNSTRRRVLQTSDNATEYYVVMPDLFVNDGSLDDVKTTMETSAFRSAIEASDKLDGIAVKSIACSIKSAYPAIPLISSPSLSPAENSITFTWQGANNTDGFVFAGVVEYSNATVEPTAIQLKKNSGYSFVAYGKQYYQEDTSVTISVSPTEKCLDYKYYWIATNQDPDTYYYTTGVKSGTTKTIGCPTFGKHLYYSFMILLGFLFMIML